MQGGARGTAGHPRIALLSFLFPGLGHAALGLGRHALLFALPALLAVGALLAVVVVRGPERTAVAFVAPAAALGLAVAIAVAGAWRLLALGDAVRRVRGPSRSPRVARASVALVALAILVPHVAGTTLALSLWQAGREIFVVRPDPTPLPTADPGATPGASATPEPTARPTPDTGRFTVLLVGVDSAPGRNHALTDTMIVVSVEIATGDVAMVSMPRDVARFPLSDGGTFGDRINGLVSYADRHPDRFPDGGLQTLANELGYLIGISVPYYASVSLQGFERMIDVVGGVTIVNPRAIDDPTYGGWTDGRVGFRLSAGEHTLDGPTALAYVRSRRGAGDNDFTRARRQQQLLVALAHKMSDPGMLPRLPAILDAASDTVRTNAPTDSLPMLLDLATSLDDERVQRVVLGPPYASRITGTDRYLLQLDMERVAAKSIELFGDDSRYAATR